MYGLDAMLGPQVEFRGRDTGQKIGPRTTSDADIAAGSVYPLECPLLAHRVILLRRKNRSLLE